MDLDDLDPDLQLVIQRNYERCGFTRRIIDEIQSARREVEQKHALPSPRDDHLIAAGVKYALDTEAGEGAYRRGDIPCGQILNSLERKLFSAFYVANKK